MDARALVVLAFKVSILCTVFRIGLKAAIGDILYLFRQPGLLARSLLAVVVLVPLLAIVLARVFNVRHTLLVALVALAISPLPPLLPKKESKAGGNQAYGIALMATLALLAIVTVPLWASILAQVFDRPLAASPSIVGKAVVMSCLIPLAAGMAVRALAPSLAGRIADPIEWVPRVLLPAAVLALLLATWRGLLGEIGDGSALVLIAFTGIALAIGHLLGGPAPDRSVVLALSSASRHPAIALSIASANFGEERFGSAIVLYVLINTVVGMAYLAWSRTAAAAPPSPVVRSP